MLENDIYVSAFMIFKLYHLASKVIVRCKATIMHICCPSACLAVEKREGGCVLMFCRGDLSVEKDSRAHNVL